MSKSKKAPPKKVILPPILNPLQDVKPRFSEEQLAFIDDFFEKMAKPIFLVDGEKLNAITVEHLQSFLRLRKLVPI